MATILDDRTKILNFAHHYPPIDELCSQMIVERLLVYPASHIDKFAPQERLDVPGWVYAFRDHQEVSRASWQDVRDHRRRLGMEAWLEVSAQTVLIGDEDMCVFTREHAPAGRNHRALMQIDAFICSEDKLFRHYENVREWLHAAGVAAQAHRQAVLSRNER